MILDWFKHLFGIHKYYRIRILGDHSHLLGCKRCNKLFSINTSVKILLEWDLELEDMYRRIYGIEIKHDN